MYILQLGLNKYFREIDINQNVIIVDNACKGMLFDNRNNAYKFQRVLINSYQYNFAIIEL